MRRAFTGLQRETAVPLGAAEPPWASTGSAFAIFAGLCMLTLTVVTGGRVIDVVPLVLLVLILAVAHRMLLSWQSLITLLLAVILFIPIRRYALPASLPFQLEPYRLVVGVIAFGWLASLLTDPRVRLRRSEFDAPFAAIACTMVASDAVNAGHVQSLMTDVIKTTTFSLSYFIVFFLIVSVIRSPEQVDRLVRVLVAGGAVISIFAIVEFNTGYNVFDHLRNVAPFLRTTGPPIIPDRSGRLRVYASAQHPIALGAAMVMLLPFALYLARTSAKRRWWAAGGLVLLGSLATLSRTAIIMLVVVVVTLLRLRPELRRLWPAVIPLLLVVHIALPNTLGAVANSFSPRGGLVAEQEQRGGHGSGRLANLGPSLHDAKSSVILGEGFATRITEGPHENSNILDDQWLGTLLETGAAGVAAWIWLFARGYRRLARRARGDPSARGWLLAAVAASVLAFPVGMITYDAFSFTQATFLLYILLAFGAVLLRADSEAGSSTVSPRGPHPGTS